MQLPPQLWQKQPKLKNRAVKKYRTKFFIKPYKFYFDHYLISYSIPQNFK